MSVNPIRGIGFIDQFFAQLPGCGVGTPARMRWAIASRCCGTSRQLTLQLYRQRFPNAAGVFITGRIRQFFR